MLQRTACRVWTDGIVLLQPCCTPVARNNCATSMQIGESLHCIENVDHSCAGSCDDLNRIVPSIVFSINCGEMSQGCLAAMFENQREKHRALFSVCVSRRGSSCRLREMRNVMHGEWWLWHGRQHWNDRCACGVASLLEFLVRALRTLFPRDLATANGESALPAETHSNITRLEDAALLVRGANPLYQAPED